MAPRCPDTSTNSFPHNGRVSLERTGAVNGAPLLGARRTLDGEDRSETMREQGKKGERVGRVQRSYASRRILQGEGKC